MMACSTPRQSGVWITALENRFSILEEHEEGQLSTSPTEKTLSSGLLCSSPPVHPLLDVLDAPADDTAFTQLNNISWLRTGKKPSSQLLKSSSHRRMLKDAVLHHSSGFPHTGPAVTTHPGSDAAAFPHTKENGFLQQANSNVC